MSALWTIQEVPESRKRKPRPAEVITESKNASLMQEARLVSQQASSPLQDQHPACEPPRFQDAKDRRSRDLRENIVDGIKR